MWNVYMTNGDIRTSSWTDLIIDQYPDVSINNPEREQHGAGGSIQIAIHHSNQKCPTQWKKYLSDGSNKTNRACFLGQEWQKSEYFVMFADFGSLFVNHRIECHKLTARENGIDCNRELDFLLLRQICEYFGGMQTFTSWVVRFVHVQNHTDNSSRFMAITLAVSYRWRSAFLLGRRLNITARH